MPLRFSVSIIIPARNEERNIGRLLDSLKPYFQPLLKIIVVNDGSTDQTRRIAESFGVQVIDSKPLPKGWTGKAWACFQGAQASRSEILFFLDADTFFEKDGFDRAMSAFEENYCQPMSILPYHRIRQAYENLSVIFHSLLAMSVLEKGHLTGQSLIINKDDYNRAGSHEIVKDQILENFFFARHLKAVGHAPRTILGKNILSMQMYPDGMASLTQGWQKAFSKGAKGSSTQVKIYSALWMSAGWTSFFFLSRGYPHALSYFVFALYFYYRSRRLGNYSWYAALFYPLYFSFFQWVFLRKTKVAWKGRDVASWTSG